MLRQLRAHHHAVVSFGPDYTAHALCTLSDSVKGKKVTLLDLEGLAQVLQSRPATDDDCLGMASHNSLELQSIPAGVATISFRA